MRVGMTHIPVAGAMHRINNLSFTRARIRQRMRRPRHLAAMSSAFRHICAR
jgi:hypothetical protein